MPYVRERAKREFAKRRHLTDEVEIKRAINLGRFMVKEVRSGAERARRCGKWRGGKCAERVRIGGRWRDGRAVRAGHSYPTPPRPLLAQMVGVIRLKKYRVLKQRYVDAEPPEPATPLPPDQREPA